jgi:hypothetical protein
MKRSAQLTLTLLFLATILGVPLAQGIVEKLRGDSVGALEVFKRRPSEPNLRLFEKEIEEASIVAQAVRPRFQLARYLVLRDLGEKALRGRRGWVYYHPELRYLGEPYFRRLKREGDDPAETIADFAAQLQRRGVALLVVPVPSKPSVHPERLVPSLRPSLALATHTQRFIGELRGRGLHVLDLYPVLVARRQARPDDALFMATDTHWTGEGVRLAAAAIAAEIKGQGWYRQLPASARRRYVRQRVEVAREGDIPRMTQIPRREQLFGRETVAVYRVLDGVAKPYEDSAGSPILLLGDSFSRIFQTDEPEAAGLIANLAHELGLPLTSIVNDGGASTLVRQELARDLEQLKGKRLVIWAFAERDIRFGMQGWQRIKLE